MTDNAAMSSATAQTKVAQLVWLGAGNTTQPAGLVAQASKTLLVEARASACLALVQQFTGQSNISVLHTLLSEHGGEVSFTEYNLAEFSALHSASGLEGLFPGLKPIKTQQRQSETLLAVLKPLALSGDNNILVIDIADISLILLKQLQAANQLVHFSQLYLQSSAKALYKGAARQADITNWLQQSGYILSTQDNTDPDLPWLQFSLNPLWQTLQQSWAAQQQAEQAKAELIKQLEDTRRLLVELQQTTEKKLADAGQQYNQQKKLITSMDTELKKAHQHIQTTEQQLCSATEKAKQYQESLNHELQEYCYYRENAELQIRTLKDELYQQQHLNTVSSSLLLKMNMYVARLNKMLSSKNSH